MPDAPRVAAPDRVLDVVIELLESDGYDGWSLATLAKRARVSLRDVYKHFPTRGDLVAHALTRWMREHTDEVTAPKDGDLGAGVLWCFRGLFEPWVKHPQLLEAYYRVRMDPAGRDLDRLALAAFRDALGEVMKGLDRRYAADLGMTLAAVTQGLVTQVIAGEMPVSDVLPRLERAIVRLTSDNAALATGR